MIGAPVHRFLRNPNYASSIWNRSMNRLPITDSTCVKLEDPKSGRTLYLVGSTHSSTRLANRTRDLVKEVKPDTVYVQANKKWWNLIQHVKGVKTQSELNAYNSYLTAAYDLNLNNTFRNITFKLRFFPWIFVLNQIKRFPSEFHPFIPGLEMKYAIEEGQKANAKIQYGGLELDEPTIMSLYTERRLGPISLFWRHLRSLHNKLWKTEFMDQYRILESVGGEAYSETLDRHNINWWVKIFEKYAPRQKKIMIDNREFEMFMDIWKTQSKTMVAVVNQWHMEGLEAHWRHTTNTPAKTQQVNPIGDFDIDEFMETDFINNALRDIVSILGRTEPATWQNYLTQYHKENFEPERSRHVQFLSWNDDHMHHHTEGIHELVHKEIPHEILEREWKNRPAAQPRPYDPHEGIDVDSVAGVQRLAEKGLDQKVAEAKQEKPGKKAH